jgi:hypothetical protein
LKGAGRGDERERARLPCLRPSAPAKAEFNSSPPILTQPLGCALAMARCQLKIGFNDHKAVQVTFTKET